MKCWLCGVEPLLEIDTTALNSPFNTKTAGRWPPATDGHQHAEQPPTPAQLEQAGHDTLMRIIRDSA